MSEALLFSAEKSLWSLSYDAMSPAQRVFFLIWDLESQVNNGGFEQYFHNGSGEYASQAPDALTKIGAHHCCEIVAQALTLVPMNAEDWSNGAQRKRNITNLSGEIKERLNELDTRFYSYPDNLSILLAAFVTAHSREFGI